MKNLQILAGIKNVNAVVLRALRHHILTTTEKQSVKIVSRRGSIVSLELQGQYKGQKMHFDVWYTLLCLVEMQRSQRLRWRQVSRFRQVIGSFRDSQYILDAFVDLARNGSQCQNFIRKMTEYTSTVSSGVYLMSLSTTKPRGVVIKATVGDRLSEEIDL